MLIDPSHKNYEEILTHISIGELTLYNEQNTASKGYDWTCPSCGDILTPRTLATLVKHGRECKHLREDNANVFLLA